MTVYIGLGSNLGDRFLHLQQAVDQLNRHPEMKVTRLSPIYETTPVGFIEQPDFLNMVVALHTSLSPEALLNELQRIEAEQQRERKIRWGPRTLDLDILLYKNQIIHQEDLIIPHPRMCERPFVLIPLRDIAGNLLIPGKNQRIDELLSPLSQEGMVRPTTYQIKVSR